MKVLSTQFLPSELSGGLAPMLLWTASLLLSTSLLLTASARLDLIPSTVSSWSSGKNLDSTSIGRLCLQFVLEYSAYVSVYTTTTSSVGDRLSEEGAKCRRLCVWLR